MEEKPCRGGISCGGFILNVYNFYRHLECIKLIVLKHDPLMVKNMKNEKN